MSGLEFSISLPGAVVATLYLSTLLVAMWSIEKFMKTPEINVVQIVPMPSDDSGDEEEEEEEEGVEEAHPAEENATSSEEEESTEPTQ